MMYELPEETINQTLAYLGKQPYEEVATIIANIKTNAILLESGTIVKETKKGKK